MRAAAVIYVGDLRRMRSFYEACFDLRTVEDDAGYATLASEAWLLTLVQSSAAIPATDPPARRADTPIKLGFEVAGIEGVRSMVASLGGRVDAVGDGWKFGHTRRCDVIDPEGNVVQLIQSSDG